MNLLQAVLNFVSWLSGQDIKSTPATPAAAVQPAPQPAPSPAAAPIVIQPPPLPTPGNTQLSPQGLRLIELFESCRLTMYADGRGIWTIGWGHALTSSTGVLLTDKVAAQAAMQALFGTQSPTQAQVDDLFEKDLLVYEKAVTEGCPGVQQGQYDAMVSFAFNCGIGNFGRSSVKRLTLAGKTDVALPISLEPLKTFTGTPVTIAEAYAEWAHSAGQWVLGLYRRRMAEAMVYGGLSASEAYQTVEAFRG